MNLTPIQSGTLKTWVNSCLSSGISDTSQILHKLRYTPVSVSYSGQVVNRDNITVQMENFIKNLASEFNLQLNDTPGQLNTKFNNAYNSTPTQTGKAGIIRKESKFWSCYIGLKTLQVTASGTEIHTIPVYTYGNPIINFEIDGNNIEEVQKG